MASRQVTTTYRQIIDMVTQNVKIDFDEAGIEDAVLDELKRSWEAKLAASRVADFSADARLAALAREAGPSSTSAQSAANNRNGSNGSNNNTKGAIHVKQEVKAEGEANESNEIGSDLDDSDDDDIGASRGADDAVDGGDFMIALYEKVTRVKNKWKVQLKDGIISVNGKDYLFSKCQGEFEW